MQGMPRNLLTHCELWLKDVEFFKYLDLSPK